MTHTYNENMEGMKPSKYKKERYKERERERELYGTTTLIG